MGETSTDGKCDRFLLPIWRRNLHTPTKPYRKSNNACQKSAKKEKPHVYYGEDGGGSRRLVREESNTPNQLPSATPNPGSRGRNERTVARARAQLPNAQPIDANKFTCAARWTWVRETRYISQVQRSHLPHAFSALRFSACERNWSSRKTALFPTGFVCVGGWGSRPVDFPGSSGRAILSVAKMRLYRERASTPYLHPIGAFSATLSSQYALSSRELVAISTRKMSALHREPAGGIATPDFWVTIGAIFKTWNPRPDSCPTDCRLPDQRGPEIGNREDGAIDLVVRQ